MTEGKYQARVTADFKKALGFDSHIQFNVYGDTLAELNQNAKDLINDYKAYNGIKGEASYYLFDTKGIVGSSIDVIGRL